MVVSLWYNNLIVYLCGITMNETESYAIHRATEPTDICNYCGILPYGSKPYTIIKDGFEFKLLCMPCYEYIKRGEN